MQVCVVRGSYEVDWDTTSPRLDVDTPECGTKKEIWMLYRATLTGLGYEAITSDGETLTGVVSCANPYRAELLAVERVLSLWGCNTVLYTPSFYVCNVFNSWLERWLANGYVTSRGSRVRNVDVIHRMASAGCALVEYVPISSTRHVAM